MGKDWMEQHEDDKVTYLKMALDERAAWKAIAGKLAGSLTELFAQVNGECPSLLNEDSGGDAELYLDIKKALAAYKEME